MENNLVREIKFIVSHMDREALLHLLAGCEHELATRKSRGYGDWKSIVAKWDLQALELIIDECIIALKGETS